jgi:hypothetical protein
MLEKIIEKTKDLYKNNRLVNVNANVLIAVAPAFLAAGVASDMMGSYQFSKEAIAVGALAADLSVFFPVQGYLHYRANKEQYLADDGEVNRNKVVKDLTHLYGTTIVSSAPLLAALPVAQYGLMAVGYSPVAASQITYWGATVITRVIHSIIGWRTGLFKKK